MARQLMLEYQPDRRRFRGLLLWHGLSMESIDRDALESHSQAVDPGTLPDALRSRAKSE
jgi:hypothetical protein